MVIVVADCWNRVSDPVRRTIDLLWFGVVLNVMVLLLFVGVVIVVRISRDLVQSTFEIMCSWRP